MSDKTQFTFLIRRDERAALLHLSRVNERSASAMLRWLIRQAARELKADADAPSARQTDAERGEGVKSDEYIAVTTN